MGEITARGAIYLNRRRRQNPALLTITVKYDSYRLSLLQLSLVVARGRVELHWKRIARYFFRTLYDKATKNELRH